MIDGSFLQRTLAFAKFLRNRTCIFSWLTPGDDDSRSLVAEGGTNGESQAGLASCMLGVVRRFVVGNNVGRTNACGKATGRFGKRIRRGGRAPHRLLATDRGGPHKIQHGHETDFDINRARALCFVGNDRDRLIKRNKKLFPNHEVWSRINADYGFGTVDNATEYVLAINPRRFTLSAKSYFIGTDDLQGISPHFQASF